jgi:Protein of unknown function (DUF3363)
MPWKHVPRCRRSPRRLRRSVPQAVRYLSQALTLSSGRFALIDNGLGFMPWTPALDRHLGHHVAGVAKESGAIELSAGRSSDRALARKGVRLAMGKVCGATSACDTAGEGLLPVPALPALGQKRLWRPS